MTDRQRVTGFAKLYAAFRAVQGEIDDLVPEFERQIAQLEYARSLPLCLSFADCQDRQSHRASRRRMSSRCTLS